MTESAPAEPSVTFSITEPGTTPLDGLVLGYLAMVPIALGTLAFALAPEPWRGLALALTLIWSASIVTFLSGVRRGISFRTPGGTTAAQIATMLWLFCLGLGGTLLTAAGMPLAAAAMVLVGFVSLEVLDPIAARALEAPLYFARLRPVQMAIPIVCLAAVAALLIWR